MLHSLPHVIFNRIAWLTFNQCIGVKLHVWDCLESSGTKAYLCQLNVEKPRFSFINRMYFKCDLLKFYRSQWLMTLIIVLNERIQDRVCKNRDEYPSRMPHTNPASNIDLLHSYHVFVLSIIECIILRAIYIQYNWWA